MRTASAATTVIELCVLLALEALCLFLGQRRLFWLAVDATGSRLLGYLLAMPGTVLHESAHYLACVILQVPAGRQLHTRDGRRARVRLFYPQRDPVTGSVTLGSVPHARTDPVRGALIAIAPLLLVPVLLVAIALLIAGTSDPAQLRHVLPELATWKLVLLSYLAFSCGQAAFPSPGDHIGVLGAFALTAILAITVAVILSNGGRTELTMVLRDACLLLGVPALASALSLLVLGTVAHARRST
ncbi:MAG: hypothetical protein ACYDHH_31885 [Solirubrobacteraceae bacterium]